jgi:hypothetical protein
MITLLKLKNFTLTADWHENVCAIFPALTLIEMRCENETCKAFHGIALEAGWLWGSVTLEYMVD